MTNKGVFIIAEIANAHEAKVDTAKSIIQAAAEAGASAIKFQVFTADELAVPSFTHYKLYVELQMRDSAWAELVSLARELGLQVFADVFGHESADLMQRLDIDGFKIHAADVSNRTLLRYVGSFGKSVSLSVGGSTWIETAEAVAVLRAAGVESISLMHGFQAYPTKLEHSFLRRIEAIRVKFGLPVGFASHVAGGSPESLSLPIWAIASGADILEIHITLDRSKKGLDYYSSLEPNEFAMLVRSVRAMEACLGDRSLRLSEDEVKYRLAHKKWPVATRDIAAGERISEQNVAFKRIDCPPSGRPLGIGFAFGHEVINPIPAYQLIQLKELKMKVAAILACRAESSRLYGKPMQIVGDRPIILHLIGQLRRIQSIDEIVLAISEGPSHHIFADLAKREGLPYVVGPEKDVLGRLIMAADQVGADIVVRETTENPYIYWENVDDLIRSHVERNADLTVTEKLPLGTFVEVISVDALKKSHTHGEDRHRSELCTLFISEHPDIFKIQRIPAPTKLQRPDLRLTVDTPEDLIVVRKVWEALQEYGYPIRLECIVDYLNRNPEVAAINTGEDTLHLWK